MHYQINIYSFEIIQSSVHILSYNSAKCKRLQAIAKVQSNKTSNTI